MSLGVPSVCHSADRAVGISTGLPQFLRRPLAAGLRRYPPLATRSVWHGRWQPNGKSTLNPIPAGRKSVSGRGARLANTHMAKPLSDGAHVWPAIFPTLPAEMSAGIAGVQVGHPRLQKTPTAAVWVNVHNCRPVAWLGMVALTCHGTGLLRV